MTEPVDIHIIVVSYLDARSVLKFIASIESQSFSNWRITVIDNSENRDDISRLHLMASGDPRIVIDQPSENLGYFGAARYGLSLMPAPARSWTIVSNADIEVLDKGFLKKLMSTKAAGVALIAPRIISSRDGRDQNPFLSRRPSAEEMRRRARRMRNVPQAQATAILSKLALKFRRNKSTPVVDVRAREVYAAHGSFVVLSSEFFEAGGNLEHPMFLFGEELTLAERVESLRLKVLYVPMLCVQHVEHGQMGVIRSRRVLHEMVRAAAYGERLFSRGSPC